MLTNLSYDVLNEICIYLRYIDIISLQYVCKYLQQLPLRRPQNTFRERLIKHLIKVGIKDKVNAEELLILIAEAGGYITGSTILQTLYEEPIKSSDIDIYIPRNGRALDFENELVSINYVVAIDGCKSCILDDQKGRYKITSIHGRLVNMYPKLVSTCNIPCGISTKIMIKPLVPIINIVSYGTSINIKKYIENEFDMTICMNYFNPNSAKGLYIKHPRHLITKTGKACYTDQVGLKFTILCYSRTDQRIVKYHDRGFTIDDKDYLVKSGLALTKLYPQFINKDGSQYNVRQKIYDKYYNSTILHRSLDYS